MATPIWAPGGYYAPGALVVPRSTTGPTNPPVPNGDFTAGDTGYHKDPGWSIIAGPGYNGSPYFARMNQAGVGRQLRIQPRYAVAPAQTVSANGIARIPGSGDHSGVSMLILWYDEADALLSYRSGAGRPNSGNNWMAIPTVTATAPAGAKYFRISASATNNGGIGPVDVGLLQWTYTSPVSNALQYRAVQPASGYSDSTEPVWPQTLGQQVIDNQVIWEAVSISRVVWKAIPILKSGATEPTWPAQRGARVVDNTISWEAVARRVEDPKCPNSKIVLLAASKVFAADDDIVAFSATVNPLDWSTQDNAGFLATGLQQYGANPVSAMGLYRGDVVTWNTQGSQVWLVDPDPSRMGLKDAFPIGAIQHHAVAPVANDLFFLTPLGVRSVGIAGGSTNLQAGDAGIPIDPLVQAKLTAGEEARALYYPAQGQYWLIFGAEAFVYTMNELGQAGKWSRYVFPFAIDDFTMAGEDIYVRHGNAVCKLDQEALYDEVVNGDHFNQQEFNWIIQWPWLDFGALGVTKMLVGFDIVGTGMASVQFGYNQANGGLWTAPWTVVADSVPGQILPMPLAAPSIAVRLTYRSNQPGGRWEALNVYLNDFRPTA